MVVGFSSLANYIVSASHLVKGIGLNSSSLINNDTVTHRLVCLRKPELSGFMHVFSHLPFSQCGYLNSSVKKKKSLEKTWLFRQFKGQNFSEVLYNLDELNYLKCQNYFLTYSSPR